jgi:hypothetical protein
MKTFVAILATVLVGQSVLADSIRTQQTEILAKVTVNGKVEKLVGRLKLEFFTKTITVELFNDICGTMTAKPGTITCLAMPVLVKTLKTNLRSATTDDCGTNIYTGTHLDRRISRLKTEITVEDNARRTCEDYRPSLLTVTAVVTDLLDKSTTLYQLAK